MTKKNILFAKILAWIFAVAAVSVVIGISAFSLALKPVTNSEQSYSKKIHVPQGTSVKKIAAELKDDKLIHSSQILYLCARYSIFNHTQPFSLKSGVYTISSSMSLKEIYNLLQSGEQEYITVRIPEGLTITKIASILEEKQVCLAMDFIKAAKDPELIHKYNINAESLEGYLFPDTYFLNPSMTGTAAAEVFVENFFEKINSIPGLSKKSPEEIHKTVTLASIVEREYRVQDEAPLIASVFKNRLRYNIGLYSCATIEYIITEIQGKEHPNRITYKDLKIDSPYNTYLYAGLTPGPISNPGLIALNAAENTPKTDYYYFVLTDSQKGSHTFSKNFDEHKAAENLNYYKGK